jgi:hypothetical protein
LPRQPPGQNDAGKPSRRRQGIGQANRVHRPLALVAPARIDRIASPSSSHHYC